MTKHSQTSPAKEPPASYVVPVINCQADTWEAAVVLAEFAHLNGQPIEDVGINMYKLPRDTFLRRFLTQSLPRPTARLNPFYFPVMKKDPHPMEQNTFTLHLSLEPELVRQALLAQGFPEHIAEQLQDCAYEHEVIYEVLYGEDGDEGQIPTRIVSIDGVDMANV